MNLEDELLVTMKPDWRLVRLEKILSLRFPENNPPHFIHSREELTSRQGSPE
jgi:hypothetical protein